MKKSAAVLAAAGLCGCATTPPVQPLLTLEPTSCSASPVLSGAKPVTMGNDSNGKAVTFVFDQSSPCLSDEDGTGSYTVFQLPKADSEFLVSVTSTPIGNGLLSPRLQILDADGKVLRTVSREGFTFHGSSLYTGLRIHSGESFLVVASDPKQIGQGVSQIFESTQVTAASTGTAFFYYASGNSNLRSFVYSHNGTITIGAQPVPKVQ